VFTSFLLRLRRSRLLSLAAAAGVALLLASCNGGGDDAQKTPGASGYAGACLDGPAGSSNLLRNAGFEDGEEPWVSLTENSGYEVTAEQAHSGESSALLRMRDPAEAQDVKVYYLVQEITPKVFPEVLSGWYRVEHWADGTPKQYLQFVVIAVGDDNLPGGYTNHQIRYPLAGIQDPPFFIQNAHFVFIGKEEPVLGQWVHFERNVREDFQRLWGAAPEHFEKLRILFEVRYDDKTPGSPSEADVYYDDLYFGPAK